MKRSSWLGGVLAVLVFGAGCGGVQPLKAFKDRDLRIDFLPGSITATPTPAGHSLLFASLRERGISNCDSLSPDVVATVNGDSVLQLSAGGCGIKGNESPGFTYELAAGPGARNATIVLEDGTHRMELEIENLIAVYQLQAQKAGFDPSEQEGANPVTRGEVLGFDRSPNLRAPATFEANVQQEHLVGTGTQRTWTILEIEPILDGAGAQLTMPTDVDDGTAWLGISTTEKPAILRCEGARSCEAEVSYGLSTNITFTP